jgi:hypothetical protein
MANPNPLHSRENPPSDSMPPRADWLSLATNAETHPALLQEIRKHTRRDSPITAALARNPATPESLLQTLWKNDPAAIMDNPIIILWEFSKPGSAKQRIAKEVQFALYQHLLAQPEFDPKPELIDPEWLVYNLERPAKHPLHVPLHQLVRDPRPQIRLHLIEFRVRKTSASLGQPVAFPHDAIEALATDPRRDVVQAFAAAIADNCLRPEPLEMAFLGRIARIILAKRAGNIAITHHIARWPCLDSALVEKLARSAGEPLLALLAAHPQAAPAFQERLATHSSEIVRAGLASATPLHPLIQKLATDSNPLVRAALASSPHLPPDIQRILFEKKDPRILQSLLENPRTAPEILESFALLPLLSINHHLRNHPNTPLHVREKLPAPSSRPS